MAWPDIIILAIAALSAFNGYRRGFVKELSGAVAIFFALLTPWFYNGVMDREIASITHLGPGSAHVVGMFLTGIVTYAIVLTIAWVLDRVAKLPLLKMANSLLGACVGVVKAAVLVWAVLYVALFFPLSPDIRADLHRSTFVALLTMPNAALDKTERSLMPWFAQPFVNPFYKRHHA